jgi:NAD+ diphosphatase
MRYPSTVNLPFNFEVIRERFTWLKHGDPVPGEAGWWVLLQGDALLVNTASGVPALPKGELPPDLETKSEPVCIGTWDGLPLRAAAVGRGTELPGSWQAEQFNAAGERLDDRLLTLGGIGKMILHWQQQGRFCSRCGGTTAPIAGSWGQGCASCGYEHFPAIHPCSIVIVQRGDECLLARKKEWAPGRYSLVAGFLDFGESLEECAAREVLEETGILVKNVRYLGSQCWPFPSQLMAGFIADYAGGEILVEESELEDVRWFTRHNLPSGFPPRRSIARWIIDRYLLEKAEG